MHASRKAASLLGAASLLIAIVSVQIVDSPVASAAVGDLDCNNGEICMFEHKNFSGCFNDLVPPNSDANYKNGSPTWNGNDCSDKTMNDKISGYMNRSSKWMIWYVDTGPGGDSFCVEPGASSSDISNFNKPGHFAIEDTFSAHRTMSSKPAGCDYTDYN